MSKASGKILLSSLLFIISLPAMESTCKDIPIKKVGSPLSEQPSAKKARTDTTDTQEEITIVDEILLSVYDFNPAAVCALLASDACKSLQYDQKSKLYEMAHSYEQNIAQIAKMVTAKASDPCVRQRYAHEEDLQILKKVNAQLHAFTCLKNFQFPQALFSPQPYQKGPNISLDKILEALILAEQQQISACCYHLTLFNVAKAFAAKKKDGIDIEFITNQTQGQNTSSHAIEHMVSNGIPLFCPRNRERETNHHKFFVFKCNVLGKPLVWTGSYNPTGHSEEHSWDNALILDNNAVIEDFLGQFGQIKKASQPITLPELQSIKTTPSEWVLKKNNVPEELWKRS